MLKRNPIAKAVRRIRYRIFKSKKRYTRKIKHKDKLNEKTIPQVREELLELATELDQGCASKIRRLVKSLYRRPQVRRAAKEHATVTPVLAAKVYRFAMQHPAKSYAKIGLKFNISNGRVSEIVAGKRAA